MPTIESIRIQIPFFGFAQCEKLGRVVLDVEYPRKQVSVPPEYIDTQDVANYFITKAKGDSMEPFADSGDMVLVRTKTTYSNDDLVFVVERSLVKIKRVKLIDGKLFTLSLNRE